MNYLVVLKNGNGQYGFACSIENGTANFVGSDNKQEALDEIPDNYNDYMDRDRTWQTAAGLHFSNCKPMVCEFQSWDEVNRFVKQPLELYNFGSAITLTHQQAIAINEGLYEELEKKVIKRTVLYDEAITN